MLCNQDHLFAVQNRSKKLQYIRVSKFSQSSVIRCSQHPKPSLEHNIISKLNYLMTPNKLRNDQINSQAMKDKHVNRVRYFSFKYCFYNPCSTPLDLFGLSIYALIRNTKESSHMQGLLSVVIRRYNCPGI